MLVVKPPSAIARPVSFLSKLIPAPILVYAPAMEKGLINPSTKLKDEQTNFNGYTPNNVFLFCQQLGMARF